MLSVFLYSWETLTLGKQSPPAAQKAHLLPVWFLERIQRLQCKKGYRFSHPLTGCYKPNSPWPGIINLFLARESLDSDIPTGDGVNNNVFYSVVNEVPGSYPENLACCLCVCILERLQRLVERAQVVPDHKAHRLQVVSVPLKKINKWCTVKKGQRFSWPGRVGLVTSRLGTGKSLSFFYSVVTMYNSSAN